MRVEGPYYTNLQLEQEEDAVDAWPTLAKLPIKVKVKEARIGQSGRLSAFSSCVSALIITMACA